MLPCPHEVLDCGQGRHRAGDCDVGVDVEGACVRVDESGFLTHLLPLSGAAAGRIGDLLLRGLDLFSNASISCENISRAR